MKKATGAQRQPVALSRRGGRKPCRGNTKGKATGAIRSRGHEKLLGIPTREPAGLRLRREKDILPPWQSRRVPASGEFRRRSRCSHDPPSPDASWSTRSPPLFAKSRHSLYQPALPFAMITALPVGKFGPTGGDLPFRIRTSGTGSAIDQLFRRRGESLRVSSLSGPAAQGNRTKDLRPDTP